MIMLKKLTHNLFDLSSLWKRTVLTTLEHDTQHVIVTEDRQYSDMGISDLSDKSDNDPWVTIFNTFGFRQLAG